MLRVKPTHMVPLRNLGCKGLRGRNMGLRVDAFRWLHKKSSPTPSALETPMSGVRIRQSDGPPNRSPDPGRGVQSSSIIKLELKKRINHAASGHSRSHSVIPLVLW